ncbi:hypothetical protein, variant [Sphaeroforma arctica JP610]|uniref:Peptidase M28 domain-containing protein n=1 Tax=Sphaeroforma arctica JP610 TaxID=667725 RepID=A0A0L0FVZ7_9EUKA|nr:hypothetical protein, variant [Sphaeroforma arctica JP610]KNC80824.1 hypothetical protein, variant [Sphaeroforma arctica JP610]|eukprot:XP_014154726.1 hypothetical protein, variant [Sphaeroforma arctica JP610]
MTSTNLVIDITGIQQETVLLVAHYDSTGETVGSEGATDNGAGTSALLALAKALWDLHPDNVPYSVRILWTGAEENGLHGAMAYVTRALENGELKHVRAVINLDTVGGGDFLYVHSAHSAYTEYSHECEALGLSQTNYTYSPVVRDQLLSASAQTDSVANVFIIHPDFPGYPRGETGSWSDHAPFACAGLPIGYVETTNFNIDGHNHYDGYSQTTNPLMWDCFNASLVSACDRDTEMKWGKIWHTQFDRLDMLDTAFPGRVREQLGDTVDSLVTFLTHDTFMRAVVASDWAATANAFGDAASQIETGAGATLFHTERTTSSHTQTLVISAVAVIVGVLAIGSLLVAGKRALRWYRYGQAVNQDGGESECEEGSDLEDEVILMRDVASDS